MTRTPLYLDDLSPGQVYRSEAVFAVDETAIKNFACQFDPQPFHLDDAAAKETVFGGLAASGWHTAAMTMHLLVTGGLPASCLLWHLASARCPAKFGRYWGHSGHWPRLAAIGLVANDP